MVPKDVRNVHEVDYGKAKANLTVLFSFRAAGVTSPPLIIYPYKQLPSEIGDSFPEEFTVSSSVTSWMKTEIFYEYIANSFYPFLKKQNTECAIILFVDGHKTHLDRKLTCVQNFK